jgi:hypothetical protein
VRGKAEEGEGKLRNWKESRGKRRKVEEGEGEEKTA